MKHSLKLSAAALALALLLTGCRSTAGNGNKNAEGGDITGRLPLTAAGTAAEPGDDGDTFGETPEELGLYNGYFEYEVADIAVTCVSGTPDCYKLEGSTLTFTKLGEDSVYAISGQFKGNIVIDVGDDYQLDLELQGLSLVCDSQNPITVLSGNEVSLTAKNGYENYIYDDREAVDSTDETVYSAAVWSQVDLEVCGKGALTVVSASNNGIHSKDDLQVKNLTLSVSCVDNALKGNDSVQITGGNVTLIATQGDGIKTANTDISSKGNQRGTVSISGGTVTIYAACDGIDAAYDAEVDGSATVLSIFTDKYSNYSEEVTAVAEKVYYLRFASSAYRYSVKYWSSEEDVRWVNAEYDSSIAGGRSTYYYYTFPKMTNYSKMQVFVYSADMTPGQETSYLAATEAMTPSASYDTLALTSSGSNLGCSWTNYTTASAGGMSGMGGMGGRGGGKGGMGGRGGMQDGNNDKGDYSTKGIKAGNEIRILDGTVNIKSYDDAIHANKDTTLENGAVPTGNVIIIGGLVTVYSNDDGVHADGTLTVSGGKVGVTHSYEGLEGTAVSITGGAVSVISSDDGINGTATSGTGIAIGGGTVYVYAGGDGIDSNSRTSYAGIVFSGGNTVILSTSSGNSAIDTEAGYQYTGGAVLALMPGGGMSSEATHGANFSSFGCTKSVSLAEGSYLTVSVGGSTAVTVKMPCRLSGIVIYLGSNSATVSTASSSAAATDENGVCWSLS